MYFEEIDWQMRIRSSGWDVRLCPSARITHLGGQSTENAKDKQFVEFNISSIKLISKHYGSFGNAVQRAAMIFGAAVRLAMWSAIPLVRSDKKTEAEAQKEKWKRLLYWWCGCGPFERLAPSSYWQDRF
jgi:GT2 family glycosyltransferase